MCHRSALLSPRPTTNNTRPVGGSIGYDGSGKRKEREMRGGLQWPVCADRLPFVFTVLCASFHRLHTLSPVTPLQALCFPFFQFLCSVSVYRCLFALSAVLQSVMCVCVPGLLELISISVFAPSFFHICPYSLPPPFHPLNVVHVTLWFSLAMLSLRRCCCCC